MTMQELYGILCGIRKDVREDLEYAVQNDVSADMVTFLRGRQQGIEEIFDVLGGLNNVNEEIIQ